MREILRFKKFLFISFCFVLDGFIVSPQVHLKRSQSHHSLLSDIKNFIEDETQVIDQYLEKNFINCESKNDHITGMAMTCLFHKYGSVFRKNIKTLTCLMDFKDY